MLRHVPFWNEPLIAYVAFERSNTSVFSKMYLQVWPRVVLFIAVIVLTVKFILVLVGFEMVAENPRLSKFFVAAFERTHYFRFIYWPVCGHVVCQMLCHLKTFQAPIDWTFEISSWQMGEQMLLQLTIFWKYFFALINNTFYFFILNVFLHKFYRKICRIAL